MIRVQVKVSGHLDYRTKIEELQKKVSDLTGRLQSTMAELEEALRSLDQVKNSLEEERRQRAAIQAELVEALYALTEAQKKPPLTCGGCS